MRAVILAGGKGARLAPYTTILPKPLMPIGDMPILEVLLRQMKRSGVNHVVLTVGHLASLLRAYFGSGAQWDLDITYSKEDEPLGTAGPIALVPGLDKTFLVTNGDVLTTLSLRKLVAFHRQKGGIATIAAHRRRVKIDLGVIQWGEDDRVMGYIEKPTTEYTVSMGLYVFEPRVIEYIPRGAYLDFPDLILKLIDAGERVNGYNFDGYWMDLGRPDDYAQANEDFVKMRSRFLSEEV
ncbi:MAG: nucleotidyltransferase [Anaerolineaceae bacterium]|jgi:NDP-sugar pyrophosphorylase family protein|nr:nucleotidyltransferase family protein [Anaerolineae bacterium]MBL1171447.1 nucleotidyltransferase family protein [Chloroflexota bacterium]MBV6467983.1 UTP--glucose-1-phosphate uridylyltransferase [Anaerolineales bacterium]MCE7906004.1 nucleotidyltransferase family protein [Anaerolineae bacterium CFX3]MDL1926116.1 nucleotidyltransferase family protein [Anaerolineae bacterium AMX1]OQY84315.1 MAG: nucleoside-diphosphate-sugar pyrophosphorylase [Anaerolineae bacterium UTCFX3]GER80223.1 nucleos